MQRTVREWTLVLMLAVVAIVGFPAGPVEAREEQRRFSFTGVTLPDGTAGDVRVLLRTTSSNAFAHVDYFTSAGKHLGVYEETDGFSSPDPEQVLQFAMGHYYDRQ
jgi:hypothetical protein